MFRRFTIILALAGLALALYVVATAKQEIPSPPPAQPPSTNPFAAGVAALGIVEPATPTVEVAAPEPGRVVEVFVDVNDRVAKGAPLFRMDGVPMEAELIRARAVRDAALSEVARVKSWPRAEDFPPVEAEVAEAGWRLEDAQSRLANMNAARERGGASDDEISRQTFLVSMLRAGLTNAEARLARMKAGSWSQDLAVAAAGLAAREADIRSIELRLERLTVRAPLDATVLKRSIEPGESIRESGEPPLVLGDLSEIRVRAQVDEEDMPIVRFGAKAVGRVRGPVNAEVALTMLRIEPLAGPKRQITGASTELIDTRVVEVLFRAEPGVDSPPMYTGQVVDVYIDAGR